MSKIVVFEGADRCGKATQSKLLREHIVFSGKSAKIVEVPIRSAVTYKLVYWMLRNGLAKQLPKLFQALQFLNRKIFQIFMLPALERQYDVIILDRWSLSTIVYGAAEGVSEKFTVGLSNLLRKPDHTIILLGSSFPHAAEDVYESDAVLQQKVREGYSNWAFAHPFEVSVFDCKQDKRVLAKKIQTILEEKDILQCIKYNKR